MCNKWFITSYKTGAFDTDRLPVFVRSVLELGVFLILNEWRTGGGLLMQQQQQQNSGGAACKYMTEYPVHWLCSWRVISVNSALEFTMSRIVAYVVLCHVKQSTDARLLCRIEHYKKAQMHEATKANTCGLANNNVTISLVQQWHLSRS